MIFGGGTQRGFRVLPGNDREVMDGGSYSMLAVSPTDQDLVGHTVSFYLVNEFGRIRAVETDRFEGDFNAYTLGLSFTDALPTFIETPEIEVSAAAINLTPATGLVSTVTGTGFAPGSTLRLVSGETVLGVATVDSSGDFTALIGAPSLSAGNYTITATSEDGEAAVAEFNVPDLTGPLGPVGPKGDAGSSGQRGATGPAGPRGEPGLTGAEGPTQEAGPAGATGSAGPQGLAGEAGAAGVKGDDGSLMFGIIALVVAAVTVAGTIGIFLYMKGRYQSLVRRLPPPNLR